MLRKSLWLLLSWTLLTGLEAIGLLRPGAAGQNADQMRRMPPGFPRLLLAWVLLLLLGALEFGISFLPLPRPLHPLVIIPGMLMVATVAIMFMEVGKGPIIVRGFAVAAMFWLLVLLGLGSVDLLTRIDYYVPHMNVN